MSRKAVGRPHSRWIARFLSIFFVACFAVLAACGGGGNDKHKNPLPILTSVSPTSATAGSSAFTLTVNGSGFVTGSSVHWNGTPRPTTYASATQLTAAITASDVASPGTATITVVSPTPGGGTSAAVSFTIGNPVPVVTSLSPSSVVAGSAAFDLTVNGSGFLTGSAVRWNGAARQTTFVSSSVLKAAIPASDVATAGTAQVTVTNPAPGGGTSGALTFTVQGPAPTITAITPSTVIAGSPGFSLTVDGTGFVPGAKVLFGGWQPPTTSVSPTQLVAAIPASYVATPMGLAVVVRNPEPNGGTSNTIDFWVTSSTPPPVTVYPMRITVAPDGSAPNGPSVNGGMDFDGNYAMFASKASNLVEGDTNGAYDLFMRFTCEYVNPNVPCTQYTTRVLTAAGGAQPNGDSGWTVTSPERSLAVSFNGRWVAFVSSASNLVEGDTNGVDDVFLAPTGGPTTAIRVSVRSDGSQSSMPASQPAVADDGRYVFFVSADPNLVPGDTNGVADVFVRDTCRGAAGSCTPSTTRVAVGPNDVEANGASGEPAFTGRFIAFTSTASNLVPDDTNGVADVFLRDLCIGATDPCSPSTQRISVGVGGAQADGPSSGPVVSLPMVAWGGYDMHGRYVAFISSATNLVAGDTNGVADAFQRDTCRWTLNCVPSTRRVSVTSAGGQIIGAPVTEVGAMTWDGEVILFVTAADGLVPGDANGVPDVFLWFVGSTRLVSDGVGGVSGDKRSYAPRLNHHPFGATAITFSSDATNLVPGSVPSPYYGSIFLQLPRY